MLQECFLGVGSGKFQVFMTDKPVLDWYSASVSPTSGLTSVDLTSAVQLYTSATLVDNPLSFAFAAGSSAAASLLPALNSAIIEFHSSAKYEKTYWELITSAPRSFWARSQQSSERSLK